MTRYILTFIIIFTFSLHSKAQQAIPKLCYKHLTGTISNETVLVMNLVKLNDSLYGDYIITKPGHGDQLSHLRAGNSKTFSGKMSANGNFRIRDWPGDHGAVMKGHYKDDQHITGTWSGNDVNGPVQLAEQYPEGSIPFNVFYDEDNIRLTAGMNSPGAVIKQAMLLPSGAPGPPVDSLCKAILRNFTEKNLESETPDKILTDIRKDYFNEYITGNQTLYKEMPGASFEWVQLKFTHIIYNSNNRVTFGISSYAFTGGAHGQSVESYTTADLKTGKTLGLSDLFKTGYADELTRLLTSRLHKDINLPETRKLSEAGYFTDEIKPGENFYLNDNGIGFTYNQYEIAPYSFGITTVFLTNEELKGILK
jgi:hypothetical protein